jgi:ribose/xylose/arabinose/galactoside ABC-type transport system permease subunit
MRYLVAMVFAFAGAILATMFLGTPVANFVVDHLSFESPDDADNLHMLTFVGTLAAGLIVGWLLGWIVGRVVSPRKPVA